MSLSKSGYIKAVAVHMKTSLGRPMENAKEIVRQAVHYTKNQADLIVFGELSISGYSCGDLFLQSFMEEQCRMAITYLCDNLPQSDTLIAVGAPLRKDGMLFNTALIFKGNELLGIVPKTFVPNYKEFYEKRWFAGADQRFSDTIRYDEIFYDEGGSLNNERTFPFTPNLIVEGRNGIHLACEICEDLWVNIPPSSFHASAGANVIANLSASNDVVTKPEYRRDLVRMQSGTNMCAYVYCSSGSGESTTDLIFSGHNIIAANGTILADSNKEATEALIDLERINNDRIKNNSISYAAARYSQMASNGKGYVRLHTQTSSVAHWPESLNPYPFVPSEEERAGRCKEIMRLQATGLAERLTKIGIRKCVIGVSGGLDSTLALLVIKEAYDMLGWPLTDIIGITMPGFGTTDLTKTNSWKLMEQLGITIRMINITDACLQHFEDIGHKRDSYDVTYENTQARERTQILMDIANKEGGIVVGTGDMSELALGWCTYNGDHMSMYAVNVSVPKTLVKYLVRAYAELHPTVHDTLESICDTIISPELLPPDAQGNIAQSTEATIGKYDLHDFFLYHFVRNGFTKEKIQKLAEIAFAQKNVTKEEIASTLDNFFRRFYAQQFKRSCLPDGPKVGTVSLSPRGDWRMPSDAKNPYAL